MVNSAAPVLEKLSSGTHWFRDAFAWLARRKLRTKVAAAPQAGVAASVAVRPPEEIYAAFFDDTLPIPDRLDDFLRWCVGEQKFRHQGDMDLNKVSSFILPEALTISSPVRVIEVWRSEGQNATEMLMLFGQNPPLALSDIGVVVFRQNVGQKLSDAYDEARIEGSLGFFRFSDIAVTPTFHALDLLIKEYGGKRPVKPPVVTSPVKVEEEPPVK